MSIIASQSYLIRDSGERQPFFSHSWPLGADTYSRSEADAAAVSNESLKEVVGEQLAVCQRAPCDTRT